MYVLNSFSFFSAHSVVTHTASERLQSKYTDRKVVETLSTNIYGAKKGDLDDDSVRQAVIAAVSYCRKIKYVCMFGIVLESLFMAFVVSQPSGVVSQAAKNGYFLFSIQPLARTRMGECLHHKHSTSKMTCPDCRLCWAY